MTGVYIILGVILCIAWFLFGYLRGMGDLKSFENWGTGFDDGWENGFRYGYARAKWETIADTDMPDSFVPDDCCEQQNCLKQEETGDSE